MRGHSMTGSRSCCFFFSSRRRHTRSDRDWSSDVCSSDLVRMDIAAPTCQPKTHPNGVIDKVTTPPAFGIAVRDDGLAYFTEFQNGGVGITRDRKSVV